MPSVIERRREIVRQTENEGRVNVDELAAQYGVSEVTIRHDLNALSERGLVVRSRGGAVVSTRLTRELSVQEKYGEHHATKTKLGQAAADLLGDDVRSVIIDSGTTTEEVARSLADRRALTVMTNGLNVATALAEAEGLEIKVTGGTLRPTSMSFYGRQAEDSLKFMHFDILILGVDGFDLDVGLATHFEQEASLNRIMVKAADRVIAVTDSSKFGRRGSHIICRHTDISALVTDAGAPADVVETLRAADVDVLLVDA